MTTGDMMSHVMGASGALFPGLGGPQPAASSQHNLLSQLGLFSSRPGNYGENIVTVAAVMCHALSRKSRDTHFRDHHRAAPDQHLSRQPCPHPWSDVQSRSQTENNQRPR